MRKRPRRSRTDKTAGGFFERFRLLASRKGRSRSRPRGGAGVAAGGAVGRYILREELGRGAMGEVWRAVDPRIARSVAIKILRVPEGFGPEKRTAWEQRFVREARAAGMLSHPGIVAIHDVGMTEDDRPYIVMELVEGWSLDAIVRQGTPPLEEALDWGAQVAEALDAAHRRGIVHRDVKPANVLINNDGRARIADFGIARLAASDLTQDGSFLGSPAFAAPEQIMGAVVDGRSDLFSLGATLYLLLTGELPFGGPDLTSLAYAICHADPIPPGRHRPGIPREVEAVVMKSLAKDPARRYRTGQEMARDLRAAALVGLSGEVEAPRTGRRKTTSGRARVARSSGRPSAGGQASHGRLAVVVALAMAVVAITLGAALLGRHLPASSAAALPARTAKGLTAAPSSLSPAPGPAAAAQDAREDGAKTASVTVQVVHELPDGLLTVWSGRRRLLRVRLEPPARGAGAAAPGEWAIRVPAGEQVLRVAVECRERGIGLEEEVERAVMERHSYRLRVRVKQRPAPKLELIWTG